jgi:hypothetical protein
MSSCPVTRASPDIFVEAVRATSRIRQALSLHFVANDYLCLKPPNGTVKDLTIARFLYLINISYCNSGGTDTPGKNMSSFLLFEFIDGKPKEIRHG